MFEPAETDPAPATGQVSLLLENPRKPEIVFTFPFDEELNDAVKELPGRWFDWRRKEWRVPAHPNLSKAVQLLLEQFERAEDVVGNVHPVLLSGLPKGRRQHQFQGAVGHR